MEELFNHFRPLMIAMTLCSPRMLTAFLIAPFFNSEMITGITRNCIVMVFVLILFPVIMPFVRTHDLSLQVVLIIVAKEAVIGALIGYLAGLFFYAIEAVGHLIDSQRGAAFASMMDPASGTQTTPLGSLFIQITILIFFTSGGFLLFLSGVYESYRIWPIESYWPSFDPEFAQFFLARMDDLMSLAFLLASPLLITLFLSDLGLGLINRFAPQLNVFFLSMPIKSGLSLLILLFYLQFLLSYIRGIFSQDFDIFNLLRQVVT